MCTFFTIDLYYYVFLNCVNEDIIIIWYGRNPKVAIKLIKYMWTKYEEEANCYDLLEYIYRQMGYVTLTYFPYDSE